MRILFLTQLLPFPLDAGAKIRAHYVLKHLVASGHEVTLCSLVRPTDAPASIEALRSLAHDVVSVPIRRSRVRDLALGVRSLLFSSSLTIDRDRVPAMHRRLDALASAGKPFDVVHADQLSMASDALALRARGAAGCVVLDAHNAVFRILERMRDTTSRRLARPLLGREAQTLARAERAICAACDRVVWVSDSDRRAVLGDASAPERSAVIPIAIDPGPRPVDARAGAATRVTFLGGMNWPPNHDGVRRLVERIWPRVRASVRDATLTIAGKDPPAWLLARARSDPRIEVTGYLDDPDAVLRETRAFVVPLDAGAGMRVKILDAWRLGLPVVSTTLGAEGIRAAHDRNLLLADDDEGFAVAVASLFVDAGRAARIGAGGRETLERHYDWRTAYAAWDDVYDDLARQPAGTGGGRAPVPRTAAEHESSARPSPPLRILFVVPYVPSPVRVRSYELVRALARAGHAVTVLAPVTAPADVEAAAALRDEVVDVVTEPIGRAHAAWNALTAIAANDPMQLRYAWSPALADRIETLVAAGKIDVVHVEHLRGGCYARHALRAALRHGRAIPIVWDSVDSITNLFEQAARLAPTRSWRALARLELPRTRRTEGELVTEVDRVLVTSVTDRDALQRCAATVDPRSLAREVGGHATPIDVVPNGVDAMRFAPPPAAPEGASAPPRGGGGAPGDPGAPAARGETVVFSGKMSYHANVAAVRQLLEAIMPIVWRTHPGVVLEIVGERPPAWIRKQGAIAGGRVRVTGRVPDVATHLRGARVAVAPILYGAGIQNKVLEALACGTPVVASPVAASGLALAQDGESVGVCVAKTPAAHAAAIVRLLEDGALARTLGARGRQFVATHNAWDAIVRRVEAAYRAAIDGRLSAERSQSSAAGPAMDTGHSLPVPSEIPARRTKVLIDYVTAALLLLVLSPVLLCIALVIRLDTPGPILHRRLVLARGGGTFGAYKFRTMVEDGDHLLGEDATLLAELHHTGKLRRDPRVTRPGYWLRRLSLDELPQLFNVLKGEMSLVGPRMISPAELARYGSTGRLLLTVRPGITGLWQVSGRSDLSYDQRVALDREYLEQYSLARDLKILFVHTLPAVLKGRGAY